MKTPGLTKNYTSDAAIAAHCFVKAGSADRYVAQAAASTDAIVGVSDLGCTAAGDRLDVIHGGIALIEYGGTVTRGQALTSDANGKAVSAGEGDRVGGFAMISGVSGDLGEILLAPAGGIAAFRDEVTVSSAELLALNATPKTLVAAPGAGKAIVPTLVTLFLDYNSAAYDGIAAGEDLALKYTDASGATLATIEATGFLDATADAVRFAFPTTTAAFTPVANAPLVLHMLTGEIATGNSPLKVRVDYKIIDTAW
jgi:hypothetical protein